MSGMEEIKDQKEDVLSPENVEKKNKVILNRSTHNQKENAKDRQKNLNAFIQELANFVPGCSQPSEKLDKVIILQNTVDFIRFHNDLSMDIERSDMTSSLKNEVGQLLFTDDLVEKNVYDYIHPEDKTTLLGQLSKHDITSIIRNSGSASFYIRFKAKVDVKPFYETLCCCGYFCVVNSDQSNNDDHTVKESSNETYFVVLAKPVELNYLRDVSSWLNTDLEFTSIQSLDGKFVYLDERCIPITGYIPREILGSMLYEFIHFDDFEHIRSSFETLLEDGEAESEHYRFQTKGRQWIFINSKSHIAFNHRNYKPEFICSTHKLVR